MNPTKAGWPHEQKAEYETLNPIEQASLTRRDAAMLDALRELKASVDLLAGRVSDALDTIGACTHDLTDQLEQRIAYTLDNIAEGVRR